MSTDTNNDMSRRSVLLRGVACAAGAATMLATTPDAATAAQLPKTVVGYQDKPHEGQECSQCALFVKPNACQTVAGTISPQGWCRLYRKA